MGDQYPDVTIRDFGPAGNPAGRTKPIEASHLKSGKWIIEPKSGNPCTVAEQPKKSKTGKHGSAKITCKLKMGYSAKAAQLMAPGHQQLSACVIEKLEYTYCYMEGDPDDKDCDMLLMSCMDDTNTECELKLSRARPKVWEKVVGVIQAGEESGDEICLIVQEAPKENKNAKEGYDILQIIIDAKLVKAD